MKKILIADDHFVVRAGTTIILESYFKNIKLFYSGNYSETINIIKNTNIDLILLDINMPESKYIRMIKELRELQENLKILIFSAYDDEIAIQYIMEGADGYINKLSNEDKIIEAVESIINKGFFYSPTILSKIKQITINKLPLNPIELLSKREKEIFDLLVEGNGNLEISNLLNIQISTISTYKNRIFVKLKVKNIADLIKLNNQYFGCLKK